ncbi:MAG: PilZ domain-containing protein [Deltaproteobacteria bacterium]|nr:PilZ domain-containing protein [Deltaproteobacteria bacterium]
MTERRKDQRFKLTDDGHFIVHARNIGKIENISLGGLCCSCVNDIFDPHSDNTIDIRCKKDHLHLQKLGINILATEITAGKSFFNVFTRTCHLKFQEISAGQLQQLHYFIARNAINVNSVPAEMAAK